MELLVLHMLDLLWDVCEMQKRAKIKRIKSGGAAVVPGAGTGAVVVPGTAAMVSDLFFFSFVPKGLQSDILVFLCLAFVHPRLQLPQQHLKNNNFLSDGACNDHDACDDEHPLPRSRSRHHQGNPDQVVVNINIL